jgi:hypothetical protein
MGLILDGTSGITSPAIPAAGAIGGTTPAAGSFTTMSATGLISPSQTVGIVGTTTNNSVQAGSVGEYVSSTVATSTSGYTSGTTANVTSISLTAGDWDVSGVAVWSNSGTLTTNVVVVVSISLVSATHGAADTNLSAISLPSPGDPPRVPALTTPVVRLLLASTTTVYLTGQTNFTSGGATMGVGGTLRARRMR